MTLINVYVRLTISIEFLPLAFPRCSKDIPLNQPLLVEAMAAKIVCRHGAKSLTQIAEYCQMANAIGDQSSLQTWRDIGAAVKRLLPDADLAQPTPDPSD